MKSRQWLLLLSTIPITLAAIFLLETNMSRPPKAIDATPFVKEVHTLLKLNENDSVRISQSTGKYVNEISIYVSYNTDIQFDAATGRNPLQMRQTMSKWIKTLRKNGRLPDDAVRVVLTPFSYVLEPRTDGKRFLRSELGTPVSFSIPRA